METADRAPTTVPPVASVALMGAWSWLDRVRQALPGPRDEDNTRLPNSTQDGAPDLPVTSVKGMLRAA